jgi:uncharacterized protein (DUF2236 family)
VGPVDYVASLFPAEPAPGLPGDPGLFGPGSEAWRIGRERALIAAGPAALLMQLSHPLVAAGVAEHSDFQTDPLHRLRATLDATVTIAFGDTEQAGAAAARVRSRHRQVRGRTGADVGSFAAGTSYRAGDPELGLWVHATLVWTALEFFDGFITPLSRQQRAAYQVQMNRSGRLFGVPEALLPDSYAEFERYIRSRVQGQVLQVGPQAQALANEVLSAGATDLVWPLGSPAGGLARVLAAGLLPPRLRAGYGLSWGQLERQAFAAARFLCKHTLPALPPRARYWPHYLVAQARVHRQPGQPLGEP